MTPAQFQHRREYQRKRNARIAENFRNKNPGKVPFSMVTLRKKNKAAA